MQPVNIALPALDACAACQHAAHRRAEQRIETIGTAGQRHEKHAEQQNLRHDRPTRRIDELRQKRIEKERRFGVEQVDQESLGVEPQKLLGATSTTCCCWCRESSVRKPRKIR